MKIQGPPPPPFRLAQTCWGMCKDFEKRKKSEKARNLSRSVG